MSATNPPWLAEARRHIGLREIPGRQHNPVILGWLNALRSWISDDETPWCGTFVAHCLRVSGAALPKHWYRARAWLDWGRAIDHPEVGCIVVFERTGGGHVGFIVGRDARGRFMVLGGNQGNSVSIAPFDFTRALGFRWPSEFPAPRPAPLPMLSSSAASSSNEA